MTLLARVLSSLEAWNVPHALIGAGALAAHGVSRATLDLDLLTTDLRVLETDRWTRFRTEGVDVDVRRGDFDDPLAGVTRLRAPGERSVDLVVGRDGWQQGIVEHAARLTIGEVVVPVVGAADLVLLKLFAGGIQDAWDIEQLLAAVGRESLAAEVERRLSELPAECSDAWQRIRKR